jgi:hypothetical protein
LGLGSSEPHEYGNLRITRVHEGRAKGNQFGLLLEVVRSLLLCVLSSMFDSLHPLHG